MGKSSKTEQEALFNAIMKLSHDKQHDYFMHLCNLYDKITGAKYSSFKNTYEFITKKGTK